VSEWNQRHGDLLYAAQKVVIESRRKGIETNWEEQFRSANEEWQSDMPKTPPPKSAEWCEAVPRLLQLPPFDLRDLREKLARYGPPATSK
jgi:hypothetical protein